MAPDKESLKDRLMNSIKKQTMINGIKAAFKKFPQARMILPFMKDALDMAKAEADNFLGDADHIIIIGRKKGITNCVVINGKKEFTISTGLKITQDKTDPAIVMIQPIDEYLKEINNSGIFDLITPEDIEKFKEMKEKGFDGLSDMLKQDTGQKSISAPGTTEETTEHTEVTEDEIIPAPDVITNS